jgi:hypothetical protein
MLHSATIAALPFAFGLSAMAGPEDTPTPIEPTARGMVQCYSPNVERRTCRSMASYRVAADGGIENVARVLLPTSPEMVVEFTSQVTIRAGQICGYVRAADLDNARILINGVELKPSLAANYRAWAQTLYEDMLEREVCTAYIPDGGVFLTRITVDAAPWNEARMRVIWVSPADGYRVGR